MQVRGHPNIVGLLGSCGTTHLSEYLPTSLDELVLASDELLPIERVVQIARDAARGLQGLHEVPGGAVVHFDLKPHQLMIGVNGMVKINDLNMCRFTGIDEDGETCPFTESHASRPGALHGFHVFQPNVQACYGRGGLDALDVEYLTSSIPRQKPDFEKIRQLLFVFD